MAVPKDAANPAAVGTNCFKEAVCINTKRIYDSCSDKDCLEDLPVYFTDQVQPVINNSAAVKVKSVEILNVYLDVEPVPFNKGFYSVDMTFFFLIRLSAYPNSMSQPVNATGIATFTKRVILYGSEGNVRVFCSDICNPVGTTTHMPKACLQVADPIALSSKLCESCDCECCGITFPEEICGCFKGNFGCCQPEKQVYVTLGLFTIVQLERTVQMMVPTYDFCIPDKESECTTDDPCQLFKRLKFPTNSFFPPNLSELDCEE